MLSPFGRESDFQIFRWDAFNGTQMSSAVGTQVPLASADAPRPSAQPPCAAAGGSGVPQLSCAGCQSQANASGNWGVEQLRSA